MAHWYVYQNESVPLGPLSSESIADAILTGRLPLDVWVGAPGGARWMRALDVPVITNIVDKLPTRPTLPSVELDATEEETAEHFLDESPITLISVKGHEVDENADDPTILKI